MITSYVRIKTSQIIIFIIYGYNCQPPLTKFLSDPKKACYLLSKCRDIWKCLHPFERFICHKMVFECCSYSFSIKHNVATPHLTNEEHHRSYSSQQVRKLYKKHFLFGRFKEDFFYIYIFHFGNY